jgi:hypothetical protein
LFEGNISEETKDKIMTFVAADGDLTPQKASGKTYYHFAGAEEGEDVVYGDGDVKIDLEELQEEAWVSLALKNKVLVTGSEEQMKNRCWRTAAKLPVAAATKALCWCCLPKRRYCRLV